MDPTSAGGAVPAATAAPYRVRQGRKLRELVVGEEAVRLDGVSYRYREMRSWGQQGLTVMLCPNGSKHELELVAASEEQAERITSDIGAHSHVSSAASLSSPFSFLRSLAHTEFYLAGAGLQ